MNTIWPALLLACGIVGSCGRGHACECVPVPAPEVALAKADAVFQGNVIGLVLTEAGADAFGAEAESTEPDAEMVRYRILVERVWKGDVPDTVLVYSRRTQGVCGFPFYLGHDYLVYGALGDSAEGTAWPPETEFPALVTDSCTRTRHLSDASPDLSRLPSPLREVLMRERILIRKLQGRDTRSVETVPGGDVEMALYTFFHGWLENPPDPLPFDAASVSTLKSVVTFLENNIRTSGIGGVEERLARARAAPAEAIGLEVPIRILDVTDAWDGGSTLIVLEGSGGRRLSVIKRGVASGR